MGTRGATLATTRATNEAAEWIRFSAGNLQELTTSRDAPTNSAPAAAALLSDITNPSGQALPNLTNTLVVENAIATPGPDYATLCRSKVSFVGGPCIRHQHGGLIRAGRIAGGCRGRAQLTTDAADGGGRAHRRWQRGGHVHRCAAGGCAGRLPLVHAAYLLGNIDQGWCVLDELLDPISSANGCDASFRITPRPASCEQAQEVTVCAQRTCYDTRDQAELAHGESNVRSVACAKVRYAVADGKVRRLEFSERDEACAAGKGK